MEEGQNNTKGKNSFGLRLIWAEIFTRKFE